MTIRTLTRHYDPRAHHLRPCQRCLTLVLPWPYPDSIVCSWCYYVVTSTPTKAVIP